MFAHTSCHEYLALNTLAFVERELPGAHPVARKLSPGKHLNRKGKEKHIFTYLFTFLTSGTFGEVY